MENVLIIAIMNTCRWMVQNLWVSIIVMRMISLWGG